MPIVLARRALGPKPRVFAREATSRNSALTVGLRAWWLIMPRDIASGGVLDLISGTIGSTILTTSASTGHGPQGNSRRPGGRGEYDSQGSGSALSLYASTNTFPFNGLNDCTVGYWIYREINATFGLYSAGNSSTSSFLDSNGGTSNTRFFLRGSTNTSVNFEIPTPGIWTHYIIVRNASQVLIYRNGQGIQTTGITQTPVTAALTNPFVFGACLFGTGGSQTALQGGIDDLFVSSRAFTPAEVWEWYESSLSGHIRLLRIPLRPISITSSAQTIALTPSQQQWQTQTPMLTRALTLAPAQEPWRTPALALTRSFFLSPTQEQWRATSGLLSRAVVLQPSREIWSAQPLNLTRSFAITPSQISWRAHTLVLARILGIAPSRIAWQAQSIFQGGGVTFRLTPAMIQWARQGLSITRDFQLTPSRIAWQASITPMTRILGLSPARLQWQTEILPLARSVAITPAREPWQLNAPFLTRALRITPTRASWQTSVPVIAYVVRLEPDRLAWTAETLTNNAGLLAILSPSRLVWHVEYPDITQFALLTPAHIVWTTPGLIIPQNVLVFPTQMEWEALGQLISGGAVSVLSYAFITVPVLRMIDGEHSAIIVGYI